MKSAASTVVRIVDEPSGSPRTTASLLAALVTRLAIARSNSANVLASIAAGFCALGREVGQTEAGARFRMAFAKSRAGTNGELLWSALGIDRWVSGGVAVPILAQLRNDIGILLAEDLVVAIQAPPIAAHLSTSSVPVIADPSFVDFTLGVWLYSKELAFGIEALAGPTLPKPGSVEPTSTTHETEAILDSASQILR